MSLEFIIKVRWCGERQQLKSQVEERSPSPPHTHTKHTVWERVRNKLLKNSNIYGGVEKTLTDGSKTGRTKGKHRKPRVS